jgi:hypothetical protein
MHPDGPALFDLPEPALAPATDHQTGPGRARETYRRTVIVDVRIVRPTAFRQAALATLDDSATIDLGPSDDDPDVLDPREEIRESDRAALTWVIDPAQGLWYLVEAGALQLIDVAIEAEDLSPGHCRTTWSTTIKLRDVPTLRDHALTTRPPDDATARAAIERSLATAWNLAADPYAPIRQVPGITWTARSASVEQIYARPDCPRPTSS